MMIANTVNKKNKYPYKEWNIQEITSWFNTHFVHSHFVCISTLRQFSGVEFINCYGTIKSFHTIVTSSIHEYSNCCLTEKLRYQLCIHFQAVISDILKSVNPACNKTVLDSFRKYFYSLLGADFFWICYRMFEWIENNFTQQSFNLTPHLSN